MPVFKLIKMHIFKLPNYYKHTCQLRFQWKDNNFPMVYLNFSAIKQTHIITRFLNYKQLEILFVIQ